MKIKKNIKAKVLPISRRGNSNFLFYKSKYKDGFYTNCAASVAFVLIVVIGSDLYNFKVTA